MGEQFVSMYRLHLLLRREEEEESSVADLGYATSSRMKTKAAVCLSLSPSLALYFVTDI
jgi:hypothetical protein